MATKVNSQKSIDKQVRKVMVANSYSWKQQVMALNSKRSIKLKEMSFTPAEAWKRFGVPASVGGVAKACDVRKAWAKELTAEDGTPMIRVKENAVICYGDTEYKLYSEKSTRKAIKFWVWYLMKNADEVDSKKREVKVTADHIMQGLFDCKYLADALAEVKKSVEDVEAVTKAYINTGDNDTPNWVAVEKGDNGSWYVSPEAIKEGTASFNAENGEVTITKIA